ncbi:RING-type E3 ubiquitin transferase [Heracleum sosnowskyi]|uniref:U-box domain-containing protein n=1 Tax=Heracleum sosnowskyi TaxID=360622 RepID=A0AAD8HQS8_9APIA|nr:RING-type E3 ubiquitin transferase [Heracleum sosnowskyi]
MVRDDLRVSIPSLFKCPISLDVMNSPVSLCTGVTYDRSSIQRWLDSGHNTCPATMQLLQTKEIVPNHTLKRLIKIWTDSVQTQSNSLTQLEACSLVDEFKLTHYEVDENLFVIVDKLTSFASESTQNRENTKPDSVIEPCLSCLISSLINKRIRIKLVHLGGVEYLGKLLSESDISVSIVEKTMKILEMLTACKEGRKAICENEACLNAIVKNLLKVSTSATEHGVTILWSLCCLFRESKAQAVVVKSNGLTKLLLLMQSNCSHAVRQMSSDMLKMFRVNSKSCLISYETKTTHIMPF